VIGVCFGGRHTGLSGLTCTAFGGLLRDIWSFFPEPSTPPLLSCLRHYARRCGCISREEGPRNQATMVRAQRNTVNMSPLPPLPNKPLGGTVGRDQSSSRPAGTSLLLTSKPPSRRLEANKLFQRAAWKGRATILASPKTALTELNAGR
jgi:hypothetical protein